ncbi:transposase [Ktedonobacter sp. SOSP1-52]|uniref:RNA-guided endonuclease InsQ/TnpB family protein n=1 Tax=Ktedonobacter sp. SOSP1-52 TaxID=2778366 RepID=UPI001916A726|nr:RNA-guided endonuclease TnpB family protein [Ktedonobacter sp. SOSP1-52]GHO70859.1 transposase [Ktedonobacter sp. SOSP1-52]
MLIYEYKLDGSKAHYAAIEEAIRIVQFIRNKCLRLWMDEHANKNELQCYCAVLAKAFSFVSCLNSQARQASADRAWSAIARFYDNCKQKKPGKKGYPRFQHDNRSVEYKTTGWKLEPDGKHITFTDSCGIGRLRLVGTRDIETFPLKQIKRVRLIRRADGHYCQFAVQAERKIEHIPTGKQVGIDVGLKAFYTDSEGRIVENPRHYRKAEKRLKRLQRRLSKKQKKRQNRKKAHKAVAKAHLKVQRQREDFARKQANALVSSHDLIAFEDLQIRNMVRNRHLAKSISDAGWGRFLTWMNYYAALHHIPVIAVPPHYTSQNCSACGTLIKKSLSVRTHTCTGCGVVLDRDHNAAMNILQKALSTVGHTGTDAPVSA